MKPLVKLGLAAGAVGVAAAIMRRDSPGRQRMITGRDAVVAQAASQLGNTDPSLYWEAADVPYPYPREWCGAFALWAIETGLGVALSWEVGRGFLYLLPQTQDPQPGDVAYFDKPYQHHAIVANIDYDRQVLTTYDGNPSVRRVERPLGAPTAFFSIQPFLDKVGA